MKLFVLSLSWAFATVLISMPLAFIKYGYVAKFQFTEHYDRSFFLYVLYTLIAYLVAFLVASYFLRAAIAKFSLFQVLVAAVGVALTVYAWHWVTVPFGHLDCGHLCSPDVLPWDKDEMLGSILALAILVATPLMHVFAVHLTPNAVKVPGQQGKLRQSFEHILDKYF